MVYINCCCFFFHLNPVLLTHIVVFFSLSNFRVPGLASFLTPLLCVRDSPPSPSFTVGPDLSSEIGGSTPPVEVGDIVMIPIPLVDRPKCKFKNILASTHSRRNSCRDFCSERIGLQEIVKHCVQTSVGKRIKFFGDLCFNIAITSSWNKYQRLRGLYRITCWRRKAGSV